MEASLLGTWFRKLLDALRMGGPNKAGAHADPPSKRRSEDFHVVSEGTTIRGRLFFPTAKPSMLYPVLVICHGIPAGGSPQPTDDGGYGDLALEFTSLGIAALIFNFRGCGESGGNFDMNGWVRDLETVLLQLAETPHIDPTRILVLGFSGGGATAVRVAADLDAIYALALGAAPAHFEIFSGNTDEIIRDCRERGIIRDADFPPDPERWLKGFADIEPRRWIQHFKGKYLLIVHGDRDELVPVSHAHELQENAPAGISELVIIPGAEHKMRLDRRCVDEVKKWILKVLNWKAPEATNQ